MFLKEPHNMLISGITNCGKTHFVLDLLETEYKDFFNKIILFCPTYISNKTYEREWINKSIDKENFIVFPPDVVKDNLNECLKIATETFKNNGNVLFLIDDCANLHDVKKKKSELCNLAFSGRHLGISVWVINQKYNSVVKDFRENIRFLVLFYNKDRQSLKDALDENNIIDKDDRDSYINELKKIKGSKLLLRLEHPYQFTLLTLLNE